MTTKTKANQPIETRIVSYVKSMFLPVIIINVLMVALTVLLVDVVTGGTAEVAYENFTGFYFLLSLVLAHKVRGKIKI